jgi:hypothetical protein
VACGEFLPSESSFKEDVKEVI